MLARLPENIGDLDQGVLHMGRHHFDVVLVERDELEFIHARFMFMRATSLIGVASTFGS